MTHCYKKIQNNFDAFISSVFWKNTLAKTEVLTLNIGKRKCICFPITYHQLCDDKTAMYANGSLFWLNKLKIVASMDLHTEKFRYDI